MHRTIPMDRRLILLGLAAGAVTPALAQAPSPMGQPEMEHAKNTAMVGAVALQTSEIALEKARNAKVKEFAKFEQDEQTTIAEILKSMDPSMAKPMPDPKMADMIGKMKAMQAGPAFDKAYVVAQIDGHQMLLKIQEDYIKVGKNVAHVAVAKLARGMVKEHLVLLEDLRKATA